MALLLLLGFFYENAEVSAAVADILSQRAAYAIKL